MKSGYKYLFVVIALLLVSAFSYKTISAYGLTPAGAPVCNNNAPGTPTILTLKSLGSGSVELSWQDVTDASSWTVAFGVQSGKYIYGVHNFGDDQSRAIKVNALPGGKYYFALRANNGCMPGAFSAEKSISLGGTSTGEPVTYETTPSTVVEKDTTTKPAALSPVPTKSSTLSPTDSSKKPLPTVAPFQPQPQPQKVSLWQKIVNFFKGMFGN